MRRRTTQRSPYQRRTTTMYRSPSTRRSDMAPSMQGWSFNQLNRSMGGAQRVEWKYDDTVEAGLVGGTLTGAFYLLNGLTAGSAANQRIGTMITMKTAEIRAQWTEATAVLPGWIRFFLVMDKQCNGVTPLLSDIMASTVAPYTVSMRNLNNRQRFRILMDKTYAYGTYTTSYTTYMHYYMRFRMPVTTQYNSGTAGTVGDIVTNSLFFVILTSTTGTSAPTVSHFLRLRYTDA